MITSWLPRLQLGPEPVGREHRVPSRVVGDREHVDARIGGKLARHLHHLTVAVSGHEPTTRDDLGRDDERTGLRESVTEGDHRDGTGDLDVPVLPARSPWR